jgi:hypothetical protein
LIDIFTALNEHDEYEKSRSNSKKDEEWLILPATPIHLNNNLIEYSAIMDGACISEIKRFKKIYSI